MQRQVPESLLTIGINLIHTLQPLTQAATASSMIVVDPIHVGRVCPAP